MIMRPISRMTSDIERPSNNPADNAVRLSVTQRACFRKQPMD